ncbi:hypothetical protein ES702_07482 [subsurface metagenome]
MGASVAEYKEFQPENVIGYVRALPPPLAHIGAGILPMRTIDDMKAVWDIVDVKVTAGNLLALDTEIPMDSPPGIQEVSQAIAKIGKKRMIKEQEKAKLFRPRPGTRDLASGEDYVYNVLRLLSEGVDDRIEYLRWQALSVGTLTYDKYGVKISMDWGIPGGNKKTASPKWSDLENSDPLQDIIDWSEILIAATGGPAIAAFCSSKVWGYLLQNQKIRNLISYSQTGRAVGYPTKAQVMQFMLSGEGLSIVQYDAKFNEENEAGVSTLTRFLGDDKFIMLASAAGLSEFGLGNVLEGPCPDAGGAPGKYADFYTEVEPFREVARCIIFAFPAIYTPGAILIGTVHS